MTSLADLDHFSPQQLRALTEDLLQQVAQKDNIICHQKAVNEKMAYELAILQRHRFGRRSETLHPDQGNLLEELIDTDIAALEEELEKQAPADTPSSRTKPSPKRKPLPEKLLRKEVHHEPEKTQCRCGCELKRIGEDISEKLDYTPGEFTVERHIRGKWVCNQCDTLTQAPVPAQVIDKGIPTSGLLAQVLVAKFADHLPLYRQERIFERAGYGIPRSTLAEWVGRCGVALQPLVDALHQTLLQEVILQGDETPVPMLAPGKKKAHQAYIWAFASTHESALQAVVYEFADNRAGKNARTFLQDWKGKLVCDDFSGYKASFEKGITEIACWAHARRKFYEIYEAQKSDLAKDALDYINALYCIEEKCKTLSEKEGRQIRQTQSKPVIDEFYKWIIEKRQKVPKGSPISKAMHYTFKRWNALIRYLDDGAVPIDNNWIENQIRPWALGRKNWLFAGSLRGGQRAAAVMSLIQSAKLNDHDPYAYLKDVLERLPTQKASAIEELLPHKWSPSVNG